MSKCTAPVHGHRSASAAANCPACSSRYGRRSYGSYSSYNSYPAYSSSSNSSGGFSSTGGRSRNMKARWSSSGSTILYTPEEIRTLSPIRENVEKRADVSDLRDVFLCHAWDDRKDSAKELHDLLE